MASVQSHVQLLVEYVSLSPSLSRSPSSHVCADVECVSPRNNSWTLLHPAFCVTSFIEQQE